MTVPESQIFDISVTITPTAVVYPGDPPLEVERIAEIGPDGPYRLTRLAWTTHFLTHLDSPSHFIPNGATIDQIPPARFSGEAVVIEAPGPAIASADIPREVDLRGRNVLFKTSSVSNYRDPSFRENHAYLTIEAARRLVELGVNMVGIDYLDVERFGDHDFPVHRELLGSGVLILEGIDLSKILPGTYSLISLPLKIGEADGSPTRAVLIGAS